MCALLRRNILGYTIRNSKLTVDKIIFPALKDSDNPDETLDEIRAKLVNHKVENVGRHGKYFWLRLTNPEEEPTVMLMHLGMTGMVKLRDVELKLIMMENGGDKKVLKEKEVTIPMEDGAPEIKAEKTKRVRKAKKEEEEEVKPEAVSEWPPRFTKFELVFGSEKHIVQFAFTDPRRLARVRFLSGAQISDNERLLMEPPLNALGPDYSKKGEESEKTVKLEDSEDFNKSQNFKDSENFTFGDPDPHHHGRPRLLLSAFSKLVLSRKKPIKALLLDQDQFAGIGNWVLDEILYHAKIYPGEVISSKVNEGSDVLKRLYESIIYVMETSVELEGVAQNFPDHWLMLHRWSKGRKNQSKTKQGHSIKFETIGGRTSCFVPELQKPLKREVAKNEDNEKSGSEKRLGNSKRRKRNEN